MLCIHFGHMTQRKQNKTKKGRTAKEPRTRWTKQTMNDQSNVYLSHHYYYLWPKMSLLYVCVLYFLSAKNTYLRRVWLGGVWETRHLRWTHQIRIYFLVFWYLIMCFRFGRRINSAWRRTHKATEHKWYSNMACAWETIATGRWHWSHWLTQRFNS